MIKASDLFEKYKYKKVQHEDGSFGYIVGYDDEYRDWETIGRAHV